MAKHKIARKVASNRTPTSNRIKLVDWIQEAHPEVWQEYCAIKDIEDAVELPDPQTEHLKAHLKYLMQDEDIIKKWFKQCV